MSIYYSIVGKLVGREPRKKQSPVVRGFAVGLGGDEI